MAQWRIKSTGTRNDGTAGTEDDWSDAQCYTALQLLKLSEENIADGDEIVWNDETHSEGNIITAALLNGAGGSITMRSRSNAASGCTFSDDDATATGLLFNPTANVAAVNITISDMTFTKEVTHTATNSPILDFQQEMGNVTLNRCRFTGYTVSATTTTSSRATLMRSAFGGTVAARTVTFNDCEWDTFNLTYSGTTSGGASPLFIGIAGTSLVITGTSKVVDITADWTGNDSDAANAGCFNVAGDITVTGDFSASNVTSTVTNAAAGNHGLFSMTDTSSTFDSSDATLSFNNVSITDGFCYPWGVRCQGAFAIGEIISRNCEATSPTQDNNLGGTFLSQGSSATGTIDRVDTRDCESNFGTALYTSGGGEATVGTIVATGNTCRSGVIYLGGDGDVTIDCAYLQGNGPIQDQTYDAADGIDIWSQMNNSGAPSTRTIRNLEVRDTVDDASGNYDPIFIQNTEANALTFNLVNAYLKSGMTNEVTTNEGATETLNLSISTYYAAGVINDDIVNGTLTLSGSVSAPTDLDKVGKGAKWWSGVEPKDRFGQRFLNQPSIGGEEMYVIWRRGRVGT